VRTDGRTDGNASQTVYPPVSLRSLGRYNNISAVSKIDDRGIPNAESLRTQTFVVDLLTSNLLFR